MKKIPAFIMASNYNADISWILDYANDYIIYDRSDSDEWIKPFDPKKVKKVPNIGWDIYDKLCYIIDNYDSLPPVLILTKGNIFKYMSRHEFDAVCMNTTFTPLMSQFHRPKMPAAYYSPDGMYHELNDSWYLGIFPAKFFKSFSEFIYPYLGDVPDYVTFSPGSNYLVRREDIHRMPKSFYETLRTYVAYSPHPGEAQMIERALYYMWHGDLRMPSGDVPVLPRPPWKERLTKISSSVKKIIPARLKIAIKNIPSSITKALMPISARLGLPREITHIPKRSPEEIAAYRKTIKIYDVFTFFNELDLLEIRLNILDPYVDFFVIIEATETFSGKPKPLFYQDNKERFKKWQHKIIHYVTTDTPNSEEDLRSRIHHNLDIVDRQIIEDALTSDNVPKGQLHWLKEFYQKESIKKALFGLRDNDICFVGDVDEIWNPEAIIDYSENDIFKLRQNVHPYYFDMRSNEPWAGTLVTKYINIKRNCLNHLRTKSKTRYTYVTNGGWHFTNQGGADQIRTKLESYGHQEFNTEAVKSSIESNMTLGKDFIGRTFKLWHDASDLPPYILATRTKYAMYFRPNKSHSHEH